MAKKREAKKAILENLKDKLSRAKSVIFASFQALGVKDNEAIRKKLKAENGEYYVAKKTLLAIALKEQKIEDIKVDNWQGQVAVIFGFGDEIAPIKVIDNFKKDKDKTNKISFLAGIFAGRIIDEAEILILAKIPSQKELYAKLVGSLNSPVSGLVNVLASNLRNFLYVLDAVKEKNRIVNKINY
jgi:large subunit ribosomal protein L10